MIATTAFTNTLTDITNSIRSLLTRPYRTQPAAPAPAHCFEWDCGIAGDDREVISADGKTALLRTDIHPDFANDPFVVAHSQWSYTHWRVEWTGDEWIVTDFVGTDTLFVLREQGELF